MMLVETEYSKDSVIPRLLQNTFSASAHPGNDLSESETLCREEDEGEQKML